jgi:cysteine-rich repeat protein
MSGDGCEANCTVTPAEPECGNGMQEADEACDDGNTMDGDGCEADCTVTPVIQDICGDGEQGDTEECDDGNNEDGDGCDADCRIGEVVSVIPTIEELFPPGNAGPLDGTLRVSGCAEANPNGTDCASDGGYLVSGGTGTKIDCAGALDVQHTYDVAGEPGVTYLVTMHFYGIMEPKNYGQSVQRDAPQRPGNQDSGSDPAPFARASGGHTYPGSDYNTYELHVDNDMDQEVGVYYMNADTSEGHWTYVIDYERQIEVIGGGRIRTRVFDRNCRQIKNCGPANTPANQCSSIANARVINLSGADPAPMNAAANQGGLLQPALVSSRDAGSAGQWWLIDIVSVDSME